MAKPDADLEQVGRGERPGKRPQRFNQVPASDGKPAGIDARARSILDKAHEAFVSIDAEGLIADWNPAAEVTFGWSREEAVGLVLADVIIPEEHREAHSRGLDHFLSTGEGPVLNKRIEITALHRDGHEFPVELTISPMRSGDGWIFNAFLHDISERRLVEDEIALARQLALAIAEAKTVEDALTVTLRTICEEKDWKFGEGWVPTPDGRRLQCRGSFATSPALEGFREGASEMTLEPGSGLIRGVWSTKEPAWVEDVRAEPTFLRAPLAREVGLAAAMAVPVLAGDELVAILALFASQPREEDRPLIDLVSAVAAQLGSAIQRRQAEDSLRKQEFQLAEAQRVAHIGSWEWDIGANTLICSDELYRILGADPEDFGASYEAFLQYVHPDDRDRFDAAVQGAMRHGEPFSLHDRIVRSDGQVRILHGQGEVSVDENGRPFRMFGTAHDVTEQKRLEEESTGFWNLSLDMLGIVGFDGNLRRVNPAHETVLGYTEDELLAQPYVELVHLDDRETVIEETQALASGTDETSDFEARFRCKDGSYRSLLCSARSNADQGLIYTVAKDVTERKRVEAERVLARELAFMISEAETVEGAMTVTLRAACERTGWVLGQAWIPSDRGPYLECGAAWYAASEGMAPFRQASRAYTLELGVGLPGRSWSTKAPVWIRDVKADPNFPRAPFARDVGLAAAIAVPVIAKEEVIAVLELFAPEPREEDEELTSVLLGVGAMLGPVMERKRAEDALRKSEEVFRLLVANVEDYAIFMLDASGHVATWNLGAQRITGYEADEIVGYHFSRFFPAEAVEVGEAERQLAQAGTEGRYEDSDWRVRKDGLRFWAHVVMNALRDDNDQLRGFSHVIQDISERKRDEEELQRLAAIVEHSGDAIISTTPEKGVIKSWNPGAERLFGYSAREVIGRPISILVNPQDPSGGGRGAIEQVLTVEQVMAGKKVTDHQTERVRKDGSLIDVSLTVSPIKDGTGTIVGISLIARDVTDRKRAQQHLEQAFGTYLDRDVADQILRDGPSSRGEQVEVTMMFIDIRGFTRFSQRYEPSEVVETLNCLFGLAVPVITGHGGHVDKFVGDGLLAVFGAPQRWHDHADRALQAALEIDAAAHEKFQGDLEIGIGIDSGTVVAGNVGGGGRLDFTVIGDAVNMAARVEAGTRHTGDTILITANTKRLLRDCKVALEERSAVPLKGESEPVPLYAPREASD